MQLIDKKIEDYCIAKSTLPSEDCDRIEEYTRAHVHGAGMLIGKMEASPSGEGRCAARFACEIENAELPED